MSQYSESERDETEDWYQCEHCFCPICHSNDVQNKKVEQESGHVDWRHRCSNCGHFWWAEGSDY